jgi:hypothetical protein
MSNAGRALPGVMAPCGLIPDSYKSGIYEGDAIFISLTKETPKAED